MIAQTMVLDLDPGYAALDDASVSDSRRSRYSRPVRQRHTGPVSTDQAVLRTRVSDQEKNEKDCLRTLKLLNSSI
jgi:hypothetical protein